MTTDQTNDGEHDSHKESSDSTLGTREGKDQKKVRPNPAEQAENSDREPLPREIRVFTADIREFFREIKKFVIFLRNSKNSNGILVAATVMLMIAGFLQLVVISLELGPLRKSADAAKSAAATAAQQLKAFQKTEGAYIGIGQYQGDVRSNQIGIPLENYGRLPSPRVWIYPHVYRFTDSNKRLYSKDYEFGGDRTEIPPGPGKYGVTIPLELTSLDITNLEAGTEFMWVAVTLRYDDGFGDISQLGFCFSYNRAHPKIWDACPTATFSDLQTMKPKQ